MGPRVEVSLSTYMLLQLSINDIKFLANLLLCLHNHCDCIYVIVTKFQVSDDTNIHYVRICRLKLDT